MADETAHGDAPHAAEGFDLGAFVADPAFWALIGLGCFIGLLIWKNVPALLLKSLDDRADKIRAELASAQALRAEAEAKLAAVQLRQAEAEREAREIVDAARREADLLATAAASALAERLARREKLAEDRISRAEADAIREVRTAAIETAARASAQLLSEQASGPASAALFSSSLEAVRKALAR
jgi:F-type H+-transporting ATPase subunit b